MRRSIAGFVVLALLLAACASGLETPADTLNSETADDSTFGYVVDPPPAGYALCAITTPSALSLQADPGASLHVYGNDGLDDPYTGTLFGVALFAAGPLDELSLGSVRSVDVDGTPALIGTIDGLQVADLPAQAGRLISFRVDEERIVQLAVRGDDDADLTVLAASVVVVGDTATLPPAALPPNFTDLGDIYEQEGRAQFRFALDYQIRADGDGSLEDQLTLLGSSGDSTLAEAFRFRAATSERVEVSGSPGVSAEVGSSGNGPNVVSWLVDGSLILRLFSFSIPPDELLTVARRVRRVEGTEWADLRARLDPGNCQFR